MIYSFLKFTDVPDVVIISSVVLIIFMMKISKKKCSSEKMFHRFAGFWQIKPTRADELFCTFG